VCGCGTSRRRTGVLPVQNSGGPSPEWVRSTNFIDSATAPALSLDGRMLAFIRVPIRLFPRGRFISSCFLRERRYSLRMPTP
jgi:hypothetical protein